MGCEEKQGWSFEKRSCLSARGEVVVLADGTRVGGDADLPAAAGDIGFVSLESEAIDVGLLEAFPLDVVVIRPTPAALTIRHVAP